MLRKRKKRAGLGAVDDDPVMLASRAIREANKAVRTDDDIGLREAAEKGWLAVSAAADVTAARLGMAQPGGAKSRLLVLRRLEQVAGLRRGLLVNRFELARLMLHGECFHEGKCASEGVVLGVLDDMQNMTQDTVDTLSKLRSRRKKVRG
jgi:hypothetical protein